MSIYEKRFWEKVEETDTCWLWTGTILQGGYGQCRPGPGLKKYAHRVSYEWIVGPIPDGLELDHLCRVRRCVNPAHLEPVTHRENMRRGKGFGSANARKTHCIRGHEFTPENTLPNHGPHARKCRTCFNASMRDINRRARLRKKAAA